MRFRIVKREPGTLRRLPPVSAPEPEHSRPRASDLDNPYGRYYGKARSWEELKK